MSEKKKNSTTSKAKASFDHILVMIDGTEHKILSEDGRYYRTSDGDFRKVNKNIKEVKKVAIKADKGLVEGAE